MFSCSAIRTLYCKQMISSSTFKSQQTNKPYKIFHEVNCSSAYVIYLIEWTLCKKQCVWKSETSFNIRLNNHRNNIEKPDAILACRKTLFSTNTQSSQLQTNLQIPPNQKTFYARDWLKEKFFGFKRSKRYIPKV